MGKDKNNETIDNDVCVTLNLDNGETIECEILTIFELNNQDYIVLEPAETYNDPDCMDAELFVYRYFETEEGDYRLENIEDDEEYEAVSDRIDELLDEQYYDDLNSDD